MVQLKSIQKQGDCVEVITAMNEHYIWADKKQQMITTTIFDAKVMDDDRAMKGGNTYDYHHFKIAYKRKIGKDVVRKVCKLLGVKE